VGCEKNETGKKDNNNNNSSKTCTDYETIYENGLGMGMKRKLLVYIYTDTDCESPPYIYYIKTVLGLWACELQLQAQQMN